MKLADKKSLNVLGINSGTSADGLDFSVVRVTDSGKRSFKVTVLKNNYKQFPPALRSALLEMADSQTTTLEHLILTDEALGEYIGRQAKNFISVCRRSQITIDIIASHGQTVRHHPQSKSTAGIKVNGTLQIGSPERIAAQTGLPIVSHFRNAHTAIGGEGAPITTTAVYHLLQNNKENRLILNIGGMANYFWLPATGSFLNAIAMDIGVGNALIDMAMQKLFGKSFDLNGSTAKQGAPSKRLLSLMLSREFFETASKQGAVSTGREVYSPTALEKILAIGKSLEIVDRDIIATLTEHTVQKIQSALEKFSSRQGRFAVYVTGGGSKNKYMLSRLKSEATAWSVDSIARLGLDPDFIESTSYALMGYMRIKEIPSQSPQSNLAPVLGRVTLPPVSKRK